MERQEENNNYRFIELTFILPGILVTTIVGFIFFLILPVIELWGKETPNLALSILLIMLGLGATCFCVAFPIYLLKKRKNYPKHSTKLTMVAIIIANILPIAIAGFALHSEMKNSQQTSSNLKTSKLQTIKSN